LLLFGGLDSYQMFAYLNCLKSLTVLIMLLTWPKNLTGWKRKH
jgi:5-methylcytosine-specific restriction endonuclease McrBC regulatory subunit McrC